jgi:hypothetical protein
MTATPVAPRSARYSFVNVRLAADQYEALKAEAERQRTGMSTIIRQALDLLLAQRNGQQT